MYRYAYFVVSKKMTGTKNERQPYLRRVLKHEVPLFTFHTRPIYLLLDHYLCIINYNNDYPSSNRNHLKTTHVHTPFTIALYHLVFFNSYH